jgi:hypothetical protein
VPYRKNDFIMKSPTPNHCFLRDSVVNLRPPSAKVTDIGGKQNRTHRAVRQNLPERLPVSLRHCVSRIERANRQELGHWQRTQ